MKLKQILILFSMFFLYSNCTVNNQLLILENVTIIDGTGNSPQPSSCIFIEGGKIIRICKKGEIEYPKDAKIIDLNNKDIQ